MGFIDFYLQYGHPIATFVVLALIGAEKGFRLGATHDFEKLQDQAIKRGYAKIDSDTGQFQWK